MLDGAFLFVEPGDDAAQLGCGFGEDTSRIRAVVTKCARVGLPPRRFGDGVRRLHGQTGRPLAPAALLPYCRDCRIFRSGQSVGWAWEKTSR